MRFDLWRLELWISATLNVPIDEITYRRVAAFCRVDVRTVLRWEHDGLTLRAADRAAIAAGSHPGLIWPDYWRLELPV